MKISHLLLFIFVVTGVLGSCIYDFNPQVDGEGGYMIVDGDIIIGEVSKMHIEDSQGRRYENMSQEAESAIGYFDMQEADPSLDYRLVIENTNGTYASSWGWAMWA